MPGRERQGGLTEIPSIDRDNAPMLAINRKLVFTETAGVESFVT